MADKLFLLYDPDSGEVNWGGSDVRIRRSAAQVITIDNNGTGGVTVVPASDSVGVFGTSSLRFSGIVSNLFQVFTALGDANATVQVQDGTILWGVGGATAVDSRLRRTGVGQITFDANGAATQPTIFVVSHGTVTLSPATGSTIQTSTSGGVANNITLDTYDTGNVPTIICRRARGTSALPTAVVALDEIGAYSSRGYGATGFSTGSRGRFVAVATETWTDAAQGTQLRLFTTPTGGVATAAVMIIDANGDAIMNGNFNYIPATTNTGHLGTDTFKWNRVRATSVVTGDLEMKDEERNAHWVFREETDRIVVTNKITGKKYLLNLKELA